MAKLFFIELLEKHGVRYAVDGDEISFQCPYTGHSHNDTNFSAFYNIRRNVVNL